MWLPTHCLLCWDSPPGTMDSFFLIYPIICLLTHDTPKHRNLLFDFYESWGNSACLSYIVGLSEWYRLSLVLRKKILHYFYHWITEALLHSCGHDFYDPNSAILILSSALLVSFCWNLHCDLTPSMRNKWRKNTFKNGSKVLKKCKQMDEDIILQ